MKLYINKLSFLLAMVAFFGCEKVENKISYEGGTPPVLTGSASTVRLEPGEENNIALRLAWTNPNYKFTTGLSSQDVKYTLEIDTLGGNFSSGKKYTTVFAKDLVKAYTVGELNAILGNSMRLQLDPRRNYTLQARVISSLGIGTDAAKLTSNIITFTASPFPPPPKVATPINDELWIVCGASQGGWNNPLATPFITSQKFTRRSRTLYDITVNFAANDGYLALPVMGSWGAKYCFDDGVTRNPDGGDFVLKGGGGRDFLSPTPAGTFKITMDFQLGKFTVVRQ